MADPAERIRTERVVAALRTSDVFAALDDASATRLASRLSRRRYRRDEVVFHQGDPGDRLHIIDSGRVRIGIDTQDGREGTLTLLGPGDIFGELVLLDGSSRSATAVALEPTTTLTLERATFQALLTDDATIREAVLVGMAAWVRRLTDQVGEFHFLDLRGRVIATLVRLARETDHVPGQPVELPALSQSTIASLVGGTRQRVSPILGDLAGEGLIDYDGKRITVLQLDRLAGQVDW